MTFSPNYKNANVTFFRIPFSHWSIFAEVQIVHPTLDTGKNLPQYAMYVMHIYCKCTRTIQVNSGGFSMT